MRAWRGDLRTYILVCCAAGVLPLLGCNSTPKAGFSLANLPAAGMHEEPLPSIAEARAAPRVLVLPLADRAAPNRIGRMHNAIDDLIRRDLMLLPELSVFPDNAVPIPLASLYAEEYRALDTALWAGERAGATHVLIGEIAARGEQIVVEIDLIDMQAREITNSVRVQAGPRRIDKELPRLRRTVMEFFRDDSAPLKKTVPGFTPPHAVLEDCGYGQNRLANGEYSQALIDFYAAAKHKRPYAGAYVGIAETQLLLGGLDLSDRAFGVALERDPDYVEVYWRYAVMRIRVRGGGPEALALCQRASLRAPLFGPAHLTLGTLWFAEKQYEHADRHFELAATLLPNSLWPIYNHAHVRRVQGDLAGARAALERALDLGPRQPRIHFDLGQLLQEQGDDKGALERFKSAVNYDPQNPLFRYHTAVLFERLGQADEALAAYQAAMAIPFRHEWLHRKLAEAFLRLKRLQEAERTLAAGYADGIRDPEHVLLYASVLLQRGQKNHLRRRDYSTRAGNLLLPLRDMEMTATQQARAEELAEAAVRMGTR